MVETLVILGAVFLSWLYYTTRRRGFTPPKTAPSDARTYAAFEAVDNLLVNASERAFFEALLRVLPSDYHLHSKVRMEDIVRVKPTIKGEARWHLRGRVKSRHVDYLITEKKGRPRLIIELDGSSHNKAAHNADVLKNGIFEAVGVPLIRVKTGENFAQASRRICADLTRL